MRELGFTFLFCQGAGLFLSLIPSRPVEVGKRFFLYHGVPAFSVMLIAFYWFRPQSMPVSLVWIFACFGLGFCLSMTWIRWVALVGAGLALGRAFLGLSHGATAPLVNFTLSTLCLGFAMGAMWLGHWYLTQPKLSISELKRVTGALVGLLILRSVWAGVQLFPLLAPLSEPELYKYLMATTPGLFLLMRVCWGLVLPLALLFLVWRTLLIRSTQAATGLLYLVVLAVITGEILSHYLGAFHRLWL